LEGVEDGKLEYTVRGRRDAEERIRELEAEQEARMMEDR
jgi:hypothetical protein